MSNMDEIFCLDAKILLYVKENETHREVMLQDAIRAMERLRIEAYEGGQADLAEIANSLTHILASRSRR